MLLLFAFSITPKLLLHDLVANHKDTPLKSSSNKTQQFDVAGFNCGCDNLVVESPFVQNFIAAEILIPSFYSQHINPGIKNFISVKQFYVGLRGPPQYAC